MAEELLVADEVARMLRVTTATVYAWARQGLLPEIILPGPGRRRRYPKAAVEALLETRTPGGPE